MQARFAALFFDVISSAALKLCCGRREGGLGDGDRNANMPCFAEWDDLPDVPGLVLANMGPSRYNVRMRIYGTEMDVCKTNAGIKAWRGWKTDPSEIALYESGYYLEIPPATANDDSGDRRCQARNACMFRTPL